MGPTPYHNPPPPRIPRHFCPTQIYSITPNPATLQPQPHPTSPNHPTPLRPNPPHLIHRRLGGYWRAILERDPRHRCRSASGGHTVFQLPTGERGGRHCPLHTARHAVHISCMQLPHPHAACHMLPATYFTLLHMLHATCYLLLAMQRQEIRARCRLIEAVCRKHGVPLIAAALQVILLHLQLKCRSSRIVLLQQ